MNKIIIIISFLFSTFISNAQVINYTPQTAAGYQFKYVKVDSGFAIPYLDTTIGRGVVRAGAIVCKPSDKKIYVYNGTKWVDVSTGGGSGPTNKVDSVTIIGNVLFYWINGTSVGVTLPVGYSQDFQQVTDNGNVTTNDISANHIYANASIATTQLFSSDHLIRTNTSNVYGDSLRGYITGDSIRTSNLRWNLPDTTGTFVLSINGAKPDRKGNVSTLTLTPPGTDSTIAVGFGLTKTVAGTNINLKVDTSIGKVATKYDLSLKKDIYTSDDTITSNRTVYLNNKSLFFDGGKNSIYLSGGGSTIGDVNEIGNRTKISIDDLAKKIFLLSKLSSDLKVGINKQFNVDSTLDIGGGIRATGGIRFTGVPQASLDTSANKVAVFASDGTLKKSYWQSSFNLQDGNGTLANGNKVDLGGNLFNNTVTNFGDNYKIDSTRTRPVDGFKISKYMGNSISSNSMYEETRVESPQNGGEYLSYGIFNDGNNSFIIRSNENSTGYAAQTFFSPSLTTIHNFNNTSGGYSLLVNDVTNGQTFTNQKSGNSNNFANNFDSISGNYNGVNYFSFNGKDKRYYLNHLKNNSNGDSILTTDVQGKLKLVLKPTSSGTVGGSGTANEIPYWATSTSLGSLSTATYPSLTELSYVKGLTSSAQTQINGKLSNITGLVTAGTNINLTGSGTSGSPYVINSTVSGTVTAIGVTAANGISGTSSGGATPNLTISLGNITPTSVTATNSVTAPYLYGGDKTTSYGGYTGAILGGTATHGILDFWDNNARIGEFYTSSSAFNFFTETGKDLNFYVNNSLTNPALNILSNGNVGIGLTTPTTKLDVAGSIKLTDYTVQPSATYTSGSTYTITKGETLFNPASVVATLTVTLPSSPVDGQLIYLNFGGTIAAGSPVISGLTFTGGTTYGTMPTTVNGADNICLKYISSTSQWQRRIL